MINNSVYVPIRAVSEALGADVSWIQEQQTVKVDSDIKMIASLPEEKTYIYALNEKDGRYDVLILSINGNKKVYDWKTMAHMTFLPDLSYIDEDNNAKLVSF
nr:stalk domain-containing protein [Syntrophomonas wolfei]